MIVVIDIVLTTLTLDKFKLRQGFDLAKDPCIRVLAAPLLGWDLPTQLFNLWRGRGDPSETLQMTGLRLWAGNVLQTPLTAAQLAGVQLLDRLLGSPPHHLLLGRYKALILCFPHLHLCSGHNPVYNLSPRLSIPLG